jgi:hypothetical protein
MQSVDAVLRQAAADLDVIGARWAVIGGLAVAFRAEPRFTKDVDLAVAVADDQEAEGPVSWRLPAVVPRALQTSCAQFRLSEPVQPATRGSPALVSWARTRSASEAPRLV